MKKNWVQTLSLALNAVLLVLVMAQGMRLRDFQSQMNNRLLHMDDSLRSEISRVSGQVARTLEEGVRLAADHRLEIAGVDRERRALTMEAAVTLREWQADTQAVLLADLAGETVTVPLDRGEHGVYTGRVFLPLDLRGRAEVSLAVTTGGTTARESLDSWRDLSALLPLQRGGWGGAAWHYQDGLLTLDEGGSVSFYDGEGASVPVENPVYRLYRNGVLLEERPGVQTEASRLDGFYDYASGAWPEGISCGPGDQVTLTFSCTDAYGLTYEFVQNRWTVGADGQLEEDRQASDEFPTLTCE